MFTIRIKVDFNLKCIPGALLQIKDQKKLNALFNPYLQQLILIRFNQRYPPMENYFRRYILY